MNFVFNRHVHTCTADTDTPISLYLKLREHFPESLLIERNGTTEPESQYSYICCKPAATIRVVDHLIYKHFPNGKKEMMEVTADNVITELEKFKSQLSTTNTTNDPFETQGLYGYMCYDAVQYFDSLNLKSNISNDRKIDSIHFSYYSLILVFDHFKQHFHIIQYESEYNKIHDIKDIESLLSKPVPTPYPFKRNSEQEQDCDDATFIELVKMGIEHCFRGDVFQIVLSRGFSTAYSGDDFSVYRRLRSISPAAYLFYSDYGDFRLMGASPEAQLIVSNNKATVHPIAGTYKRGKDIGEDMEQIQRLKQDPKENAEHTMLVDLARNDLSKNYKEVEVTVLKKIQQHAYVFHMVSEVVGRNPLQTASPLKVMADTFPAGTLSGAPKYKAVQLIDHYETNARSFYGGAIGYLGFNGDINMAIMIRSILSKDQKLHYQAGAGVVAGSVPILELQEVNHKLSAIRMAIELANTPQS